jgi:DNA-binding NarL/FixJ family response regulator
MNTNVIRLVVVDDHTLFRRGLVGLLSDMPEFNVIGDAANGVDALGLIHERKPDVVLLDVNMPDMDGIQTVQAIRKAGLSVRILMLTISQSDADLLTAIRMGADGYMLKNTEPEALREGILRLVRGEGVLSPEITGTVMRALARSEGNTPQPILSDREMDVLRCLADGLTTQQIGNQLFISENTVKTHVRHILEKLEAANRTEAVSKAISLGLIH